MLLFYCFNSLTANYGITRRLHFLQSGFCQTHSLQNSIVCHLQLSNPELYQPLQNKKVNILCYSQLLNPDMCKSLQNRNVNIVCYSQLSNPDLSQTLQNRNGNIVRYSQLSNHGLCRPLQNRNVNIFAILSLIEQKCLHRLLFSIIKPHYRCYCFTVLTR